MSAERYTQEQILCGLRILWREEWDCDSPLEPEMRIDKQFDEEGLFDVMSLYEIKRRLGFYFGFHCSAEEWGIFLGTAVRDRDEFEKNVAPHLTFRDLANFIRERMEPIPFEPLALLGSASLAAGIFRGIEQLVHQIRPKTQRFGPSTPIQERLSRWQRHALWGRLRWITQERIPEPPIITIHGRDIGRSLLLKMAVSTLIAVWQNGLKGVVIGLVIGFYSSYVLCMSLAVILGLINYHINPFPKPIETFGDLARYLAAVTVDQQPQGA